MQDFIAIATIFIALSFTAIVMIDFISGLVAIWEKAGSQSQPQVSASVLIEQSPAPKLKAEVTLDPWALPVEEVAIALAPQQMNNIKPIFLLPAGAQDPVLLAEAAPEVAGQPENAIDYTQLSIRQLKRLASGRVKNYSSLTKSQLISALAAA